MGDKVLEIVERDNNLCHEKKQKTGGGGEELGQHLHEGLLRLCGRALLQGIEVISDPEMKATGWSSARPSRTVSWSKGFLAMLSTSPAWVVFSDWRPRSLFLRMRSSWACGYWMDMY